MLPFDPPLLPNFAEFVSFEAAFSPQEVDNILALWKEEQAKAAAVDGGNAGYDDELRKSSVQFLEPGPETRWLYQRIADVAFQCNSQMYGFELRGFMQPLQLTRYGVEDFFEWHMDFHAGPISHRKLSVTVQLSEPDSYEGGNLQFMINHKHVDAPRARGSVVVFPSFIHHRVTPITRGVRQSIVGWISGAPFR